MPKRSVKTPPPVEERIVPDEVIRELYDKMLHIYYVEERMKVFVKQGKCTFNAPTRGHEKVQAGIPMLLKPGHDWFYTYYREKGVAVSLGMDLKDLFLGMLSRDGDPNSGGVNMPEQWSSRELKLVSQTACTGSQYLPAVGMAKACKKNGKGQLVYVSSGEGATSEGEFFEALNWAQRETLPVLFVVQNNGYAISVPQASQTSSKVHRIAEGFGMRAHPLDGTWFEPMYQILPEVIRNIRDGKGPALIECSVVRLESHSSSDDQKKYRSEDELEEILERDPVLLTENYIIRHQLMTESEIESLRRGIKEKVDQAAEDADSHPFPRHYDVLEHVFSENSPVAEEPDPGFASDHKVSMVQAINRGLREEMERNPKIVMWGEDIGDPKGGVFGVTRGLGEAFPGRVVNAALAEASIVGIAGGMATGGYKPIVEIQFADYIWPGFMQLRNEIASIRWRSDGVWDSAMVVRVAVGGYIKGGPWHSANIESFFAHIPGWYIVYPATAADAKGLIKTAARAEDPVLFLEHKGLYRRMDARTPEPVGDYLVPFGKARVINEGSDLTIVSWGTAAHLSKRVAEQFAEEGPTSVEVIDLRTLIPWDQECVFESIRKSSRVLIAHEDTLTMGFGAEVAAKVADECFDSLDAPVGRVGAKDCFIPSAANLELEVLPSVETIRAAAERILAY
ncbi:MAG: dehydrogenase E1 component subunit alpha/beta [Bryobacterales bacterium]|nr:dehydrogenase E1 component subunit alpha/beta [Bryobacterales bacterium]